MAPSDILDPAALTSQLPTLLPEDSKALASPQDALAALVHTVLTKLAFRLTAIDETPTSAGNVLPAGWNTKGPGHYSFKYRHDQSSLEFAITVSKLGSRTLLNAIALESDKVATLDVSTEDFTSSSFYPFDQANDVDKSLVHGFISSNRITDFVSQLKLKIIQKILPGLQKEGYTDEVEVASTSSNSSTSAQPPPARPRAGPPPDAPDFDDPYEPRGVFPTGNPLEIGRRDLDPFPRNPFSPPNLFPPGSGDGMYLGGNHPIFNMGGRNGRGQQGPWGGDGYLPPLGAPPGARFDPVGPVFPSRPPRGPRVPGHGNTQDPGNDEFMPPGMGDMFM